MRIGVLEESYNKMSPAITPSTSMDTEHLSSETDIDLTGRLWSANEADDDPITIMKKEDIQWDNMYHSLMNEYYTLKAMIAGSADDSDAFDKKVFAFMMDQGSCPVSWREIFSMARYNLRELVCFPYANEVQIKKIMKLENSNIYSTWQHEVMDSIKQKLRSIHHSLKMSLVGKPDGKLKSAVQKVQEGLRNEKKTDKSAVTEDKVSKKSQLSKRKETQAFKSSTQAKVSHTSDEYIKALARVKQKGYITEKLKLLRSCRQTKGRITCSREYKTDSSQYIDSSKKETIAVHPVSDCYKRRYPMRPDFVTEFTLIRTVLIDKLTQDARRYLVERLVQFGYNKDDLINRLYHDSSLQLYLTLSFNQLRTQQKRLSPCTHRRVMQLRYVCKQQPPSADGLSLSRVSLMSSLASLPDQQASQGGVPPLSLQQQPQMHSDVIPSHSQSHIVTRHPEEITSNEIARRDRDGHERPKTRARLLKGANQLTSSLLRPIPPQLTKLVVTGGRLTLITNRKVQRDKDHELHNVSSSQSNDVVSTDEKSTVDIRFADSKSLDVSASGRSTTSTQLHNLSATSSKESSWTLSDSDTGESGSDNSDTEDSSFDHLSPTGWSTTSSSSNSALTVKSLPIEKSPTVSVTRKSKSVTF